MTTAKDLIEFCAEHGVSITIDAAPMANVSAVNMKVFDYNTDRCFARLINLIDLYHTEADIVKYILDEAKFYLKLDDSPEQRTFDAKIEEFKKNYKPDYVVVDGVEIPYSEYKRMKEK